MAKSTLAVLREVLGLTPRQVRQMRRHGFQGRRRGD